MELEIARLVGSYMDFIKRNCTESQAILNMAWLADKLEFLARIARKELDKMLDERK